MFIIEDPKSKDSILLSSFSICKIFHYIFKIWECSCGLIGGVYALYDLDMIFLCLTALVAKYYRHNVERVDNYYDNENFVNHCDVENGKSLSDEETGSDEKVKYQLVSPAISTTIDIYDEKTEQVLPTVASMDSFADIGDVSALAVVDSIKAQLNNINQDEIKSKRELYSIVLVQLPMFNEEAYCKQIIRNACAIDWPIDKLLIQVCDDSNKQYIKDMIDEEVDIWQKKGFNVSIVRRADRVGFKAGNMIAGMEAAKPLKPKYVVIFDADFNMPRNFLKNTVPRLEKNSNLALVQTRWTYTNVNCFLTWFQYVNLSYHFDVEQTARSYNGWFWGFNGTAGVWRVAAMESVGGWTTHTTVEDMDLSLRAYLKGWEFTYVNNIHCSNELPDTHRAYRNQQFRWLSGPMQIFRESFVKIFNAEHIVWWKRLSCYIFFLRFIVFQLLTVLSLLCLPLILFIETSFSLSDPSVLFFIVVVNFSVSIYLFRTKFSVFYLLFSIGFGVYKGMSMVCGALGLESSKTWIVTPKKNGQQKKQESHFDCSSCIMPYVLEGSISVYYLALSAYATYIGNYFVLIFGMLAAAIFLFASVGDNNPFPSCFLSFDDLDAV
eukprot:gene10245-13781_t